MTRSTGIRRTCAFHAARFRPWGLLALLALGGVSCGTPSADASWADHDPTSTERLDHSEWQALLDACLVIDDPAGVHLVDYAKLQANAADRGRLAGY